MVRDHSGGVGLESAHSGQPISASSRSSRPMLAISDGELTVAEFCQWAQLHTGTEFLNHPDSSDRWLVA